MLENDIRKLLILLGTNPNRIRVVQRAGLSSRQPIREEVEAECPLAPWAHQDGTDRSRGFGITVSANSKSKFCCFACGSKGSLVQLLWDYQRYSKQQVPEASALIAEKNLPNPFSNPYKFREYEDSTSHRSTKGKFFQAAVYPESYLDGFLDIIDPYMGDRKISDEVSRELEVKFDSDLQRVVFPIRDANGGLVGAVGRAVESHIDPPYWNYWHFPRGLILACENQLTPTGSVAVVEGFFDLAWLRECGVWNVVALLASAETSRNQINRLAALGRRIFLLLDNDAAGKKGCTLINKYLGYEHEVHIPEYPLGKKEPTDLTRDELVAMLTVNKVS